MKLFQASSCSWISIVVVSLMGKAPNAELDSRFEQADKIYKRAMAEMKNTQLN